MPPTVIYVMGVTACGKSTVGAEIAASIGWEFFDGDSFHTEENKRKMKSGIPLTDEDRLPWLKNIREFAGRRKNVVIPCSSLKKIYRDTLRRHLDVLFVFLKVDRNLLEERVNNRPGHFMNPNLLQSQLDTLEDPSEEPSVITVRNQTEGHIREIVEEIKKYLN